MLEMVYTLVLVVAFLALGASALLVAYKLYEAQR